MKSLYNRGAHKVVHPGGNADAPPEAARAQDPTSMDDLFIRLKRGEIKELKLCYRECDFIASSRSLKQLEKALRLNKSVTSVSIGWRYRSQKVLGEILKVIARHTKLVKLQLILDTWIPEHFLRMLFHHQADTLREIDIRAVHVKRKNPLGRWCCERHGTEPILTSCDHCLVTRVLVPTHNRHPNLKSLNLMDCRIENKHAVMLADYLHIRGGIAELSVRGNRLLGAHGISVLIQSPVTQKLDLSLCDMGPREAQALAPAILARPWPLGELLLCGNYRMGPDALSALVQPGCCSKIVNLNISYCDITGPRAITMFKALSSLDGSKTMLKEISMQGAKVATNEAAEALATLLKCNLPLRVIRVNDPGQPMIVSPQQFKVITAGMETNFHVELLCLDLLFNTEMRKLYRDMDFYLRLNRAGRRILLENKPFQYSKPEILAPEPAVGWFDVLEKSAEDLDTLFWMVRHSADRFTRP